MKKIFFGTLLLTMAIAVSIPTLARAGVNVNISLPPPIVFAGPPELIVLPETYVYVVPDIEMDIFFYGGWWWRPWEGHWYRSHYYDRGWGYYQSVPSFYVEIPSGWRNDYRDHRWGGHQWNYQRIPHQQVQKNWSTWERDKHWEKQQTWGVQGLKPKTRSQQPPKEIQPKSQTKPQVREAVRPQSRKADKPQSREVSKPQSRKADKPQSQEVSKPQSRKADNPQPQKADKPERPKQKEGTHE